MDISQVRRDYLKGGLRSQDLLSNPVEQFNLWLQQAIDAGLSDPTAMTVATVDASGQPFQRIVLLKDVEKEGFIFYTNLGSRKAQHIEQNAKISLHFPWHSLERQVHITGVAEKLTVMENMKYFTSRPKESQIAAIASKQSQRLSTRQLLEAKYHELKAQFEQEDIPAPKFWGGYRIRPTSIEFWQGGNHRLHDRFIFERDNDDWQANRLAP
ncbi:pyridoxamine 5'-phosphate oxidase [Vibrio sp.]|nr:pyridoxamine 5'-phosphate oxidase [Vibrio sp.]